LRFSRISAVCAFARDGMQHENFPTEARLVMRLGLRLRNSPWFEQAFFAFCGAFHAWRPWHDCASWWIEEIGPMGQMRPMSGPAFSPLSRTSPESLAGCSVSRFHAPSPRNNRFPKCRLSFDTQRWPNIVKLGATKLAVLVERCQLSRPLWN
jgi:hypothetical protein